MPDDQKKQQQRTRKCVCW